MESTTSLRVLCIADIHIANNCIKECLNLFDLIYEQVGRTNPDIIVTLGDLLHTFGTIHTVPLTHAIEFLKTLSIKRKVYTLIGNHERLNNTDFLTGYHPFVGISDEELHIIDKVNIVNTNGFKFIFCPYVYPGRFMEALDTKKDKIGDLKSVDAVFAHQEIYSTKMGAVVSTIGDKWDVNNPYLILGHIHDRTQPQNNVNYIGTPRQTTFAEEPNKSISLFTFTKSPGHPGGKLEISEERIFLNVPKKMNIRISARDTLAWIPPENAVIKLIVEGTNAEIKSVVKLDYIKQLTKKGIKIVYNTLDEIKVGTTDKLKKDEVRLPFQQRFYNTVKDNPRQLAWYNYIFNK
ncbi:MAG TPA: metallophosphoesterase [Aquella sp.]|nr:metallophosphoesterase [Aquella sp.]